MAKVEKSIVVLLFVSIFLLNFTAKTAFCFDIPRKEELELKVKARMKYINLDLTKVKFTEDEKRKIESDFKANYGLNISQYDPATNMAIVNIIAKRFDNMAMIQKWYFDGNIWRDDLDLDIIVNHAMPKWLKGKFK